MSTLRMAIALVAGSGLLLAACGLPPDGDEDGDGLTNGDEEDLGTDPELSDTDGDGLSDGDEVNTYGTDPLNEDTDGDTYSDGDEVEGNTNPDDEVDHPYMGGWPIDACRSSVEYTGDDVGQIPMNFALMDQFGEYVQFHDMCNQVIFMIGGAFT